MFDVMQKARKERLTDLEADVEDPDQERAVRRNGITICAISSAIRCAWR